MLQNTNYCKGVKLNSTINILDQISVLDWLIFTFILVLTLAMVIYGNLRKNNLKESNEFLDHLLMGRQLTLPLFVATLVATWYGGIFGVTQIAFESGIYNFITQGVFWYIAYLIFAFFLVDKITPYKAITLPDLLGKMFGPISSRIGALFNFLNVVPVAYTIGLGLFTQALFGGELWSNMLIGIAFVLLYSTGGGLRSVVYSDLIQFLVMCSAVFIVVIYSIMDFGGPSFLQNHLPISYFKLTGNHSLSTTFVWGLIALSTLVDPNFYQRVFAAKSPQIAKKGILISTLIWICFDLCTTMGAMYAKAVIPNSESGQAYMIYALQLLPNGLKGFFMAGILATILSTIDSYLFVAGTSLSFDLTAKKHRTLFWHRLSVILVGLFSVLLAHFFNGNIKSVWKTLGSYSAACLLLPVLIGHIFPGRISDRSFSFACLVGVVGTSYWRTATHNGFWKNVDEIYIGTLCTGVVLFTYMAIYTKFKKKKSVRI
ncbi:MAG: sodium:solute symporter family protein [Halobacteriovoraceae bacterium]|nr:sodium:solute symporter family protein [Halobacteriovoraceae bacterium]